MDRQIRISVGAGGRKLREDRQLPEQIPASIQQCLGEIADQVVIELLLGDQIIVHPKRGQVIAGDRR